MNRIYVFGHKNPYSDTICSAIVYAGWSGHRGCMPSPRGWASWTTRWSPTWAAADRPCLLAGERQDIFYKAFGLEAPDGDVFLPGVLSRKKQVVPLIMSLKDEI